MVPANIHVAQEWNPSYNNLEVTHNNVWNIQASAFYRVL